MTLNSTSCTSTQEPLNQIQKKTNKQTNNLDVLITYNTTTMLLYTATHFLMIAEHPFYDFIVIHKATSVHQL